jgi:glutaredoxin 3
MVKDYNMGWLGRLLRRDSRLKHEEQPLPPLSGLILYKINACPYCKVVQRAIAKHNVDIELRDTKKVSHWRRDLKRRTGRTQVPCLFIDGQPMFESNDIVSWLNNNYQ